MTKVTPAMVGRQIRFAARSVRDIAREPSRGRSFTRMVRTLPRRTLALRLPWLPFALIEQLEEHLDRRSTVFEYGGGGSTAWFLDRAGAVTTVEHNREWHRMLAEELGADARLTLLAPTTDADFSDYVAAIDAFPDDSFDLVVVDGRERIRCFERAVRKVRPGGWLVLDDVDRSRYAPAFDLVDWPREVVIGFAPCKPTLAYTAVFRRPVT